MRGKEELIRLKNELKRSRLFKDSFWAVLGNGSGNALLLLAGIVVARLLGKDLYGEYGMVKTTMFYVASFATFGLSFTSTKFIATSIRDNFSHVRSIVHDALLITFFFSGFVALALFVFAPQISDYLEANLVMPFRTLALIIVFRAVSTTQIGILAGMKNFKILARNNFVVGVILLFMSIPLTYFMGLKGALVALFLSQLFNVLLNGISIRKVLSDIKIHSKIDYKKKILLFSLPVALQESSFSFSHWLAIMLLTKLSSLGELGLYTASAQWSTVVLLIPALLGNVVLSYLSGSVGDKKVHDATMKKMVVANLICTFLPFLFVCFFANFIVSFYGDSFEGMVAVLRVLTISTIFEACSTVFRSELMAQGRPWILFAIRFIRDMLLVVLVYSLLIREDGENGALLYSQAVVIVSIFFFFLSLTACRWNSRNVKL